MTGKIFINNRVCTAAGVLPQYITHVLIPAALLELHHCHEAEVNISNFPS